MRRKILIVLKVTHKYKQNAFNKHYIPSTMSVTHKQKYFKMHTFLQLLLILPFTLAFSMRITARNILHVTNWMCKLKNKEKRGKGTLKPSVIEKENH